MALKALFGKALRFAASAGLSAALSIALPILLHEGFAVGQEVAVAIGLATAYVVNIFVLKVFVFRSSGNLKSELIKFIPTNGAFRLLEYGLFLLALNVLGLDYRIAIVGTLIVTFALKFFVYNIIFSGADRSATGRSTGNDTVV